MIEVRFRKGTVRRLSCEQNIRFKAKFMGFGLWLAMMACNDGGRTRAQPIQSHTVLLEQQ